MTNAGDMLALASLFTADAAYIAPSGATDLGRTIAFYCDVLGAVLVLPPYPGESPSFSGRMAVVMLGPIGLDLYEHTRNGGEEFEPARTGLDHLGLIAGSQEELESWAAWLDARDVPRSELRDASGVGRMFDFVDPDGIQLEFLFLDEDKLQLCTKYSVESERNGEASP